MNARVTNFQQSAKAFGGLGVGAVNFIIKGLYRGAVGNKARVKKNAGVAIRKILFPDALGNLLVQLMLVHSEEQGDGGECSSLTSSVENGRQGGRRFTGGDSADRD
jgi:hypothetical protein